MPETVFCEEPQPAATYDRSVRRLALLLVLLAPAAGGCGGDGGTGTTEFEDVRPCLERLALVAANRFTGTITTPTGKVRTVEVLEGTNVVDWSVELAYRSPRRGANAAHLAFYKDADAAKDELTRTRAFGRSVPQAGTTGGSHRMLAQAERTGDTAVLTWSTPPTNQQKRRLKACF